MLPERHAELGIATPWDLTIGIAAFPEDGQTFNELLAVADERLYEQRGIAIRRETPLLPAQLNRSTPSRVTWCVITPHVTTSRATPEQARMGRWSCEIARPAAHGPRPAAPPPVPADDDVLAVRQHVLQPIDHDHRHRIDAGQDRKIDRHQIAEQHQRGEPVGPGLPDRLDP